jgi:hypothetical protein
MKTLHLDATQWLATSRQIGGHHAEATVSNHAREEDDSPGPKHIML